MIAEKLFHAFVLLSSLAHISEQQIVRCDLPTDVVFLLDASSSIKPGEWQQEKDFVSILIDSLAVEPHAIHVGVIVYSTDIGQVIDLQPFKSRAQLKAMLHDLVQDSQGTDTARAIAQLRSMVHNQGRPGATPIGVVITDGRSEDVHATIQEALNARTVEKISLIALGVGNETYLGELEEIAKTDSNHEHSRLFKVSDFTQLQSVVKEMSDLICKVVPLTSPEPTTLQTTTTSPSPTTTPYLPPISCHQPADVVFLLDGSHSIEAEDWDRGRSFVSSLINSLEVGPEGIHVGIIVYSSDIGDTVPIKPYLSKVELKQRVAALRQTPLGRTNTALGLQELRAMFAVHGRPGVPHIGVVITDGKSSNVQETKHEANLAKTAGGVVMVVIGVGKRTLQTELEAMATSPSTLFNVSDFSALIHIVETLRDQICEVLVTTIPPYTEPTTPPVPALCRECLQVGGIGYNSYPPDCPKYVICYPQNGGYKPVVASCAFGLYWSSEAVSCLDAMFVDCPSDPCRSHPEGWTHSRGTGGCAEYWTCRAGQSVPQCCHQGHSYSKDGGCVPDPTCRDVCSLQWTLQANDICAFRPDPESSYSYLQLVPGRGHVTRPCRPGTVYSHRECACVARTVAIGCHAAVHFKFDGSVEDQSVHRHPAARGQGVALTRYGTAFFNGSGLVQVNTLPADHFRDKFVLHLRYRLHPSQSSNLVWNDHYNWGFQEWFGSQANQQRNVTFIGREVEGHGPDPALPSGQQTVALEKLVILRNGSVVHKDAGTTTGGALPEVGPAVTRLDLGGMATITDTVVSGGVVFVPNRRGQILVFAPPSSGAGSSWQIVSADGSVVQSGPGEVPHDVVSQYGFQLRPAPTSHWFIMLPTGKVIKSGVGSIPDEIRNLYARFTPGKLLEVKKVADDVVEWKLSKPDGSSATGGTGAIPASIYQQLNLQQVLTPEVRRSLTRWAVLSSSGQTLATGTGDVPPDVSSRYGDLRSGLLLQQTDAGVDGTIWSVRRADGTTLVEGAGSPPTGVTQFVRDSLVLPILSANVTWEVVLPNGTRLTGQGQMPDYLQGLFRQTGPQTSVQISSQDRWYITNPSGKVLDSGYGRLPKEIPELYKSTSEVKIIQQSRQDQDTRQWQLLSQDGRVLSSGMGQPPADVFKAGLNLLDGGSRMTGGREGTFTSGSNYPGYRFHTKDSQQNTPGHGVAPGSGTVAREVGIAQRRWTVTMPDGTVRSGTGEMPADLQALLHSHRGSASQVERRWTVTLPDGSQRTGVGEMPADLASLLSRRQGFGAASTEGSSARSRAGEGQAARVPNHHDATMPDGSARTASGGTSSDVKALGGRSVAASKRRWSVRMPDGTLRTGVGDVPPELEAGVNGGAGARMEKRWSVTMPDGTRRTGVGELPADIRAIMSGSSAGDPVSAGGQVQRSWQVTMPDGTIRRGQGDIPSDLRALMSDPGPSSSLANGNRLPRATTQYQDVAGNCVPYGNGGELPSFLLQAAPNNVRLTLRTTSNTSGATLTLPATPGMNDVRFVYDGSRLVGYSNGIQKQLPLSGSLLAREAPLTIGQCIPQGQSFLGEIDEISLSACIP